MNKPLMIVIVVAIICFIVWWFFVRSKRVDDGQYMDQPHEYAHVDDNEEQGRATEETLPDFIPSDSFKGSLRGYVFKMSEQGLGYHVDHPPVV